MPEKGLASVWTAPGVIEIRSWSVPKVEDDTILLQTGVCGICGTDGHLYKQTPPYPAILCHEITGKIVDMGPEPFFLGFPADTAKDVFVMGQVQ